MKTFELLPKKPLIQVDRILDTDEKKIITRKCITESDYFIFGHFVEKSIYPGLLLYEAAIQSLVLLLNCQYENLKIIKVKTRFIKPVVPGDIVEFHVNKERTTENTMKATGFVDRKSVFICTCSYFIKD
ncbi:3-hydroxyacyl-ACP dehydratase FabZ family protein [Sutcliffiella rhizosphaerae]|uniref:3-hydroxyacyl-[acyl-carrier-protein] dehydratase FabZ n=1 Tax=Sutcliffiella rhizosphaerae TaxID=2880967 RepID=A0ABN8ADV8_9BACI|nr:hypothetical protein [Sutcliffiella rhizosphaerae]CAG9623405.1 3-hydroxyacyl-[acyl-carrier-protein] dehydratase FabZ [Sutcliffiella rhizosphaerae]